MSSKTDIWMPLYIGDYLADTARLTTEQHGAYLLLLMDYWRNGKLPDNDQILAQITKLTPDAWSNARAMLSQFFCIENGFWIHHRVEQELKNSIVNKEKKHTKAVNAANARWKKSDYNTSSNATSITTSNAQEMLEKCPSPSPSPSIKKDIYSSNFELFWKAYPLGGRAGKGGAWSSWKKINPDEELVNKILKSIDFYKQSKRVKDGFIKNPQTWLNQRCWEDEDAGFVDKSKYPPEWRVG